MKFTDLTIVADENIPYVQEAFETIGTVKLVPGRAMNPSIIKDAQILLVRSVTTVNKELLEKSQIQFVGTATAGLDHIELEYLKTRGIVFASAQGGNANSVAEYVVTALLIIAERLGIPLSGKTIGIVGVGNIGELVKVKAKSLGMTILLNDPPLEQKTGDQRYRPLKEALDCDVVSLHIPLSFEGPFKTFHLINEATLSRLMPSAIFINTSRGEVVDTQSLLNRLQKKSIGPTVLDVWEFEPFINWELFKFASLGTPHIAGYSLDGKARGIYMIYQALCQHLGITPSWSPIHSLPSPVVPEIEIKTKGKSFEQILGELMPRVYDLEGDYGRMAALLQLHVDKRALEFDRLRKNYPIRREFPNTIVKLRGEQPEVQQRIAELGFKVGP